jgi:hypothetical protein
MDIGILLLVALFAPFSLYFIISVFLSFANKVMEGSVSNAAPGTVLLCGWYHEP